MNFSTVHLGVYVFFPILGILLGVCLRNGSNSWFITTFINIIIVIPNNSMGKNLLNYDPSISV